MSALVKLVRPFNRMALDVSSYGQDAQMFGVQLLF